jgi:membrane protein
MVARQSRARTLVSAIFTEIRAENITFMAGSIAYHAFVSLLPLLILLLSVASFIGNQSFEQAIFDVARAMLSQRAQETFIVEIRRSTRSTSISVVGGLVLLWGTLRIFRGLDTAFSDIYETEEENTLPNQIIDGIVVLIAVGMAIVVSGYLTDLVRLGNPRLNSLVGAGMAVFGLMLAFLPMYVMFPDTPVTLKEVIPGTLFTAVGLTVFKSLFGLYLQFSSRGDDGTIVGAIVVLLTWLYFSGLVILLGVVINAVLANRSRDINIQPVFGGESAPDPNHSEVSATRDQLVEAVESIEELLREHKEVRFGGGDDEISIPPPTHVIGDTETPLVFARGRPVRLELQWTPSPESDDGDGDGGGGGDGDGGGGGGGDGDSGGGGDGDGGGGDGDGGGGDDGGGGPNGGGPTPTDDGGEEDLEYDEDPYRETPER